MIISRADEPALRAILHSLPGGVSIPAENTLVASMRIRLYSSRWDSYNKSMEEGWPGNAGSIDLKLHETKPTRKLFSAVSYNIHQCVGIDRRRSPARIAQILNELDADVIGLQEVHSENNGTGESHQMEYLAQATGRTAIAGPMIARANGEYGNVLLSRHPVINTRRLDLSVPGREARGAIDADIDTGDGVLRVIVSHLGLRVRERIYQTKHLLAGIAKESTRPVIVLLDFNEWFPLAFPILRFNEEFGKAPSLRTFPSPAPIFSLDRIWVKPQRALVSVRRYITPLTRVASDHLPLHASIDIDRRE